MSRSYFVKVFPYQQKQLRSEVLIYEYLHSSSTWSSTSPSAAPTVSSPTGGTTVTRSPGLTTLPTPPRTGGTHAPDGGPPGRATRSVCLYVCIYVCECVNMPVILFICLPIYMSVCQDGFPTTLNTSNRTSPVWGDRQTNSPTKCLLTSYSVLYIRPKKGLSLCFP